MPRLGPGRHGRQPMVRHQPGPGHGSADSEHGHGHAHLPAGARGHRGGLRLAGRGADGLRRGRGAGPFRPLAAAGKPGRRRPPALWRDCRCRSAGPIPGQSPEPRLRRACQGRRQAGFLAAVRHLLRLRLHHQRACRDASDRALQRSRAGRSPGRKPARRDGLLRPLRDDLLRLAHGPSGPAQAPLRLLRAPGPVADLPALRRLLALWPVLFRRLLWAGLDRDRPADGAPRQ